MTISKQQREFYKLFSQHGSGDSLVEIAPKSIVLLAHIAFLDLHGSDSEWMMPQYKAIAKKDFFTISHRNIEILDEMTVQEAITILQSCGALNSENIIFLYLKNLCELYRRRFKFMNILKNQPFPLVEQIGPRCLIEYGNCDATLLFTWMSWRKWIYDVDNRIAQETGYLFEPILASCLGGSSIPHRQSPIKRINDAGNQTDEGRQIDCLLEDTLKAYELKMRVTIAASGQGRFEEEMSFPLEAERAGLKPVLLVFDPTPSALLEKLAKQYVSHGGRYAIGDDAWNELISKAGKEMGIFINKYIEPPIRCMGQQIHSTPKPISLFVQNDMIVIRDTNGNEYNINRSINKG